MLTYVLLIVPVALLVFTVAYAILSVKKGKSPKKALSVQLLSFLAVGVICLCIPAVATAAEDPQPTAEQTSASQTVDNSKGLGLIAAALVTGLAGIGGGIAVAAAAPAAIGATSEDPKAFGKALIFVALGEGIALYGLLISILILGKV